MHTQGGKMASRRALHFVFKVADRTATAAFYRETLGMKVSMTLLKFNMDIVKKYEINNMIDFLNYCSDTPP
jgi:catechol 2,3-dioxygenase-like lactoylglutathione lyase family enzyme